MPRPADDDALDRIIDEAARQLTSAAQPAGMRQRIVQRVSMDRSPAIWMLPAAAAVAALVFMAVLVNRNHAPQVTPSARPLNEALARPEMPATTAAPASASAERRAPLSDGVRSPTAGPKICGPANRRRVAVRDDTSPVAILAPPALEVPSIAIEGMPPAPSLAITPLDAIDSIAIAPIGDPEGDPR